MINLNIFWVYSNHLLLKSKFEIFFAKKLQFSNLTNSCGESRIYFDVILNMIGHWGGPPLKDDSIVVNRAPVEVTVKELEVYMVS